MPVTDPWLPDDPVPLIRPATPISVWRWKEDGPPYEEMTSLRCISIQQREGTDPGTAVLRYAFDGVDPDSPQSVQEAVSTAVGLPKSVEIGDRLLVLATQPDGTEQWIFDGKPLTWSLEFRDGAETVLISCVGIAKACWDTPIPGAYMRNADAPATVDDVESDLIAHFNPKGEANATPLDADATGHGSLDHPTFLGPVVPSNKINGKIIRKWDLAMAVRYILGRCNDETVVISPKGSAIDSLLISREPKPGTPFDPNDSDTYTPKLIFVPDTPITGRDWPSTLYDLVRHYGFGMRFDLQTVAMEPQTFLRLFLQQEHDPKSLLLQVRGETLDPAKTNVGHAQLSRDLTEVANHWVVQGAPDRYEVSFILQAGFPMSTTDGATLAALKAYDRSSPSYATADHDSYRLYIFDECGEGHYAQGTATKLTTTPDLDPLFGEDLWVKRRRKPLGDLITTDGAGKPLRYSLSISKDYVPGGPGLWDGSGNWQPIEGGFELLKDRIGVRITCDNPNNWKIGKSLVSTHPYPAGVVKGVEAQATTGAANFHLRLTCVVEADHGLNVVAERRDCSPLTQTITRVIDARDRYRKLTVLAHSEHNNTATDKIDRDDVDDAQAEADAVRYATDSGVLDGQVVIPRFTAFYEIGDRIDKIEGRDVGLRTNTGGSADDAPVLPVIVGRRWDFEPKQRTTLELSDSGTNRGQYKRALLRRKKDAL